MASGCFQRTLTDPARQDWIRPAGLYLGQPLPAYSWVILQHVSLTQIFFIHAPKVWEPLQSCAILYYRTDCLFHRACSSLSMLSCSPLGLPMLLTEDVGLRLQRARVRNPTQGYNVIFGKLICDTSPHICTRNEFSYLHHKERYAQIYSPVQCLF